MTARGLLPEVSTPPFSYIFSRYVLKVNVPRRYRQAYDQGFFFRNSMQIYAAAACCARMLLHEQQMEAVAAQCGLEITHQQRINEKDGGPVGVFHFPEDVGENFSEWILGLTADEDYNEDEEYDEMMEHLYDGERGLLEKLLRRDWTRLGPSFKQLPNSARWTMHRFTENQGCIAQVMPVLCDDEHDYLMLPTSVECVGRTGALTIPDPFHARDPAAGHNDYMARDTWFEDCGDGGAYVLGLDETVLIFYVDGPGDMVYGRWQCSREQWESMWRSAFGSLSVMVDTGAPPPGRAEDLPEVQFQKLEIKD